MGGLATISREDREKIVVRRLHPYKKVTLICTQSGSNAPVIESLEDNTFGYSISDFTWGYSASGTYTLQISEIPLITPNLKLEFRIHSNVSALALYFMQVQKDAAQLTVTVTDIISLTPADLGGEFSLEIIQYY